MNENRKRTEETILGLVETIKASPFEKPVLALIPILSEIAMNLAAIADALEEREGEK